VSRGLSSQSSSGRERSRAIRLGTMLELSLACRGRLGADEEEHTERSTLFWNQGSAEAESAASKRKRREGSVQEELLLRGLNRTFWEGSIVGWSGGSSGN
jgi:hypothetical protein